MNKENSVSFKGGAKRSELRPRYDLIPKVSLEALANRFTIGANKFGDNNWKQGDETFFRETRNHLVSHLWDFLDGNETEESSIANLEAVLWNASALLWYEKVGKNKNDTKHK